MRKKNFILNINFGMKLVFTEFGSALAVCALVISCSFYFVFYNCKNFFLWHTIILVLYSSASKLAPFNILSRNITRMLIQYHLAGNQVLYRNSYTINCIVFPEGNGCCLLKW